jgi:hypothetical protein
MTSKAIPRSKGDLYDGAVARYHQAGGVGVLGTSVPKTVTIDAGAKVDQVVVTVRAAPPGEVQVKKVAEVRDISAGVVIDFGKMRTVTGVVLIDKHTMSDIYAWQGAAFSAGNVATGAPSGMTDSGSHEFDEVLTERLKVVTSTGASDFAASCSVILPTAPTDLEVVVDGKRAWFQQGEAKRGAVGQGIVAQDGDYFVASVDITDAVAAAVTAAAKRTGVAPGTKATAVAVELRAATPGFLALDTSVSVARVYTVDFPGPQQVVAVASEGPASLDLPLPATAPHWRVKGLSLTASAKLDPARVLPPTGPAASSAAELLFDLAHPIALEATRDKVAAFGTISGVRIPLRVDTGTAEVGGVLLAASSDAPDAGPGDPIDGGELTPLTVNAGANGWTTLTLRRPIKAPAGALWIALQAAHGTAAIGLASSGGKVRRGRPGGPWRGFSTSVAVVPAASLRLIGEASEGNAIDALSAAIGGATTQSFTPTTDGSEVDLAFDPAVTPSGATLRLDLIATAPGAYRFGGVQIFYRLDSDGA